MAGFESRHDVRMVHERGGSRLAEEALDRRLVADDFRGEDLEGYHPPVVPAGFEDPARGPLAHAGEEFEATEPPGDDAAYHIIFGLRRHRVLAAPAPPL